MTKNRMSAITNWRTPEEALPNVPPGGEYEHVVRPQKTSALCWILVRDLHLVRLQIGASSAPTGTTGERDPATEVMFTLKTVEDSLRSYQPTKRHVEGCESANAAENCGCADVMILAGQDVRVTLRNDSATTVKPRAALLVQEEVTR